MEILKNTTWLRFKAWSIKSPRFKACSFNITVINEKCLEMRVERTRLQNVTFEERLTPKAPYYELPAGMMVPLIKPESVTVQTTPFRIINL